MNTTELVERLNQLDVNPSSYSIGASSADEQYVIREEGGAWLVFYAERGLRSGLKQFASEDEACDYFLNLLERDTTTRTKN